MDISPPQLLNTDVYVSGDVTIDPSAAIAPGVMLHADPDAQIVIGAGVCIGKEAILHVHQGILEIETGAILGAKVLVVGAGKIGENACIGSETTLLAIAIEPKQVIPPGSLIGDTSRILQPEEPPRVEPVPSEQQVAPVSTSETVKPAFHNPYLTGASKQQTKPVSAEQQVAPVSTPETVKPAFHNPYLTGASKQQTVKPVSAEQQVAPVSTSETVKPAFHNPYLTGVSKQQTKPVSAEPEVAPVSTSETVKPAFHNPYLTGVSKQQTKPVSTEPQVAPVSKEENVEPNPPQVQEEPPGQLEQPQPPLPPIVYGKDHLSQLLDSLLPHRKAFNGNSQKN